jgi:hypothetical protein
LAELENLPGASSFWGTVTVSSTHPHRPNADCSK